MGIIDDIIINKNRTFVFNQKQNEGYKNEDYKSEGSDEDEIVKIDSRRVTTF